MAGRTRRFEAYVDAFTFQPFALQYFNSMYIAVVVTLGTMLVRVAGRLRVRAHPVPRAERCSSSSCSSGLLVPSEVTIVPLFQMFNQLGLVNTHWPILLVSTFGAPSVLATFIMRQFFIALPVELEEAARLDGLGRVGDLVAHRHAARHGRPRGRRDLHVPARLEPVPRADRVPAVAPSCSRCPRRSRGTPTPTAAQMWNVQLAAATMTACPCSSCS